MDRPVSRQAPTRFGRRLVMIVTMVVLATAVAAGAMPGPGNDNGPGDAGGPDGHTISPIASLDGPNSTDAARLTDGVVGDGDEVSWGNAGNPWSRAAYPMTATIRGTPAGPEPDGGTPTTGPGSTKPDQPGRSIPGVTAGTSSRKPPIRQPLE